MNSTSEPANLEPSTQPEMLENAVAIQNHFTEIPEVGDKATSRRVENTLTAKKPFDIEKMSREIKDLLVRSEKEEDAKIADHLYRTLGNYLNKLLDSKPKLNLPESGVEKLETAVNEMEEPLKKKILEYYDVLEEKIVEIATSIKNNGPDYLFELEDGKLKAKPEVVDKIAGILTLMQYGFNDLSEKELGESSEAYKQVTYADIVRNWQKKRFTTALSVFEGETFENVEDLNDVVYELAGIRELLGHLGANLKYTEIDLPNLKEYTEMFKEHFADKTVRERLFHLIKYNFHHLKNSISSQKLIVFDKQYTNLDYNRLINEPAERVFGILEILIRCARAMETIKHLKAFLSRQK